MLEALINLKDTNQLTINRKTCKKITLFLSQRVWFLSSVFLIFQFYHWITVNLMSGTFVSYLTRFLSNSKFNACSIYDFTKTHFFVRYLNVKWIFASIIFIRIYINKHVKVCHCALPCPSPYILRQLLDKLEIVLLKKI